MLRKSIALLVVSVLTACGGGADRAAPAAETVPAVPPPAASAVVDSVVRPALWEISEQGIGEIRVGMTVAHAATLVPGAVPHAATEECAYVGLDGLPAGVSLMTEGGRIVRVDADDSSAVSTTRGVRVGATEASVLAAYPGARVEPHKYEDGHYVIALPNAPADTMHRIVFETVKGVVKRFRGGVIPAVEYVEGCS